MAEASTHIEAPKDVVFELFTTADGIRQWMASEAEIDLRPGGAWRWTHDDGSAVSGEYVLIEPHDRVSFTYGWEEGTFATMTPGSTRVDVEFQSVDSGTTVTIRHSGVPTGFRDAHLGGWTYFLGVLANAVIGAETPLPRLPVAGD